MNYEPVYRTALATPGLLNMLELMTDPGREGQELFSEYLRDARLLLIATECSDSW